jgi:hypothetical protein
MKSLHSRLSFQEIDEFFKSGPTSSLVDPMEAVNRFHLTRLKAKIELMEQETRLCEEIGSATVAEYGFRGGKEAVFQQLLALYHYRLRNPYKEGDRAALAEQAKRLEVHNQQIRNNPLKIKRLKLWESSLKQGSSNPSDVCHWLQSQAYRATQHLEDVEISIHNRRECVCYNNE